MLKDAPPNGGASSAEGPTGPGRRVSEMQTKLHRWAVADPGRRFDDLFNFVYDPATLMVAFDRVTGNRGGRTPGIDGLSAADVEERIGVPGFLEDLRAALKAQTFHPVPVRQRTIPKPGGSGKVRKLGIPTIADRVVQAALKLVLEPIFEADFQPVSYGFRPKRRAHDAIAEIHMFGSRGYRWVLDADIEACFDQIDHVALMDRVRSRVKDKRVLRLVKAFLKSGVLTETGTAEESDTGTPQGGVLSPLLANIALSVLDEHVMAPWRPEREMGTTYRRHRRRRDGLPTWRIVRYADDFARHEALYYRVEWKGSTAWPSQRPGEAEGSLIRETPGRAGSSPDNAETCRYCQTVRVRQARQEGAREELVPKSRKRRASSNLVDMGWSAARECSPGRSTPKPGEVAGGEAMVKDCGVAVAMLSGQQLGTSLVNRWCGERGNRPRSPSPWASQVQGGQARRRLMAVGRGGGLVVVRAGESPALGEGGQQVSSKDIGMPGARG